MKLPNKVEIDLNKFYLETFYQVFGIYKRFDIDPEVRSEMIFNTLKVFDDTTTIVGIKTDIEDLNERS